jgi:hypothetical protein
MGSNSAARSARTSTTRKGQGRHRVRTQRTAVPYAWLGAGAVSLGIGAASFAGSAVAQADDSAAPSSTAGGNGPSTDPSTATSQASATTQASAADAGTDDASSKPSKPKASASAEKPATEIGDGRNGATKGLTKKPTTVSDPAHSTIAPEASDPAAAPENDASAAAPTKPASTNVTTSSTGRHRSSTADAISLSTADSPRSAPSAASTTADQISVASRSAQTTNAVAPKKPDPSPVSEAVQLAAAVLSNASGSTAPVPSPEPAPTPSTLAAAEPRQLSVSRDQVAVDAKTQVAQVITKASAATQAVQQRVVPKAAAVPNDPVQATLQRFIKTFFNKTPTVSFTPGETTTLKNGTITGVIRGADADGDVLTYTAGPTANGGTVAISTDGTFVYTPGAGVASKGVDTFLVTASDMAAANGWHIHGLMGLLMPGWQATATTKVTIGRAVTPTGPTIPTIPTTPTGPTIPTNPNPPNGSPSTDPLSAAAVYGWGAPDARLSDEFSGSGKPSATWGLYNSVGHAGNGLRRPEQITVQDGYVQIAGTSNATTGGMMGSAVNPAYGRWEARMRVDKQGAGNPYHAVVALIPYGVPYNNGAGDLDFAEADVDEGVAYVFIHHPTNKQSYASTSVALDEWHTYSIEVAPDHISWFVDGKVEMTTTNRAAITGKQWTTNLQLDANNPSGLAPSNMQVDYFRYYPLPPSGAPIIPGAAPNIGNYP